MRAGRLRHRVRIENPVDTADSQGSATRIWNLLRVVWAALEPLTAREQLQAAQVQHGITHNVLLRHVDGITPKSRLIFGTRTFHIVGISNTDERKKEWVLTCSEKVT